MFDRPTMSRMALSATSFTVTKRYDCPRSGQQLVDLERLVARLHVGERCQRKVLCSPETRTSSTHGDQEQERAREASAAWHHLLELVLAALE
jgi:hypothetical protein